MTDTCTTLTAAQKAQIVAASYKLIDFSQHIVKTYTARDARNKEQAVLDLHADALLDLLQDL